VRDRDAPPNTRGTQVFASLEHLEEDALRLVVESEQRDELLEGLVLGVGFQIQLYGLGSKEISE
jgi:hypothetical protein